MSEWRDTTLGAFAPFQYGKSLPESRRNPAGSVSVFGSNGTVGLHDVGLLEGPTIIIGRKGSVGEVHYSTQPCWPIDTTFYVEEAAHRDLAFTYYMLKDLRLQRLSGDSAVPGLNRETAHRQPVAVPPLDEQVRIGAALRTFDELIENNRRRIELLEQMAQASYREWFVRFRYPGHEHVSLVDSPLGPIPGGWNETQLAQVATIVRGRSYRRHELVDDGGLPFVNLKCMMRGGGFRRDGLKRYGGEHNTDQRVREGDIVLAVTDLTQGREILARATLVPRLAEEAGVISLDVVRVVPHDPGDRLALFFALRHTDFADRVKEFANGSTVLHLSPTHLAEGRIVWPPAALREQFTQLVEPFLKQAEDLADSTDRLAGVRDLLLPKLVTGQIDVSGLQLDALVESAS